MATAFQAPGDAMLVRYVLGTLPADEAERLDELSIVDGEFADRLRAIEHDLADAYARGELSADERTRWEERYLSNTDGRDDLRFARALAAAGSKEPASNKRSWLYALAAAAVVIFAVAVAMLLTKPQRDASAPKAAEQKASPPASPSGPPPAAQEPRFVALTLAAPLRDLAEPLSLRIPAGTDEVRLTLRLEPNAIDRFNVEIRDAASNRVEWERANVSPSQTQDGRSLLMTVPVTALRSGLHLIQLSNGVARGEIAGVYPLKIVLE